MQPCGHCETTSHATVWLLQNYMLWNLVDGEKLDIKDPFWYYKPTGCENLWMLQNYNLCNRVDAEKLRVMRPCG